jgi:hypothetical protein
MYHSSRNNIKIHIQKNTGNNALGQSSSPDGNVFSGESIYQGELTNHNSNVVL